MKHTTIVKMQKRLGLTQQEFADKLGISYSYVQKLHYGIKPITESVERKLVERSGLDAAEIAELDK